MPSQGDKPSQQDPHQIDGVKNREQSASRAARFPWIRAGFFVAICGAVIVASGPLPEKIWRKLKRSNTSSSSSKETRKPTHKPDRTPAPPPPPVPTPTPAPTPPVVRHPSQHTASSGGDVKKMSKGFTLKTQVVVEKGGQASDERKKDDAYVASYELKIRLPQAAKTLSQLESNTANLGTMFPGLESMIPSAKVSPFFYQLYDNKTARLKKNATQLNELMTRHNFYDCETMLNLTHANSKRRVLLVQAEMDVVSDGSDGDRLPTMPDNIVNSSHYQPMTSYGWKKTGTTPNPLIAGWKNRIAKAKAEIATAGTTSARKTWLRARIRKIEREIEDMKARSYLIADYDPFVVMPINMVTKRGEKHAARIGDYCVVVHDGILYPAIVGDAGPSFKVGEASLRLAKEINPRASSYSRPVSDLTVTYIVFPGSADKFQAPDYSRWRKRCEALIKDIGGLGPGYQLYQWKNTLPTASSTSNETPSNSTTNP